MIQKILKTLGYNPASRRPDKGQVSLENARIPENHRAYVIGDIHGRSDLLNKLLRSIGADADRHPEAVKQLIYLGDYVDRGPQSREVIDTILQTAPAGASRISLMGNHEEAMLTFLRDPLDGADWLQFGGAETLLSYGVSVPPGILTPTQLRQVSKALNEALPANHRAFFDNLQNDHVLGDYMFVHAGVNPDRPLTRQQPQDLRWIRDSFIDHQELYGKVIVHGHTITENWEFHPNRIGLDTGAYFSGQLTCLVLEGGKRRVLQTGAAIPIK